MGLATPFPPAQHTPTSLRAHCLLPYRESPPPSGPNALAHTAALPCRCCTTGHLVSDGTASRPRHGTPQSRGRPPVSATPPPARPSACVTRQADSLQLDLGEIVDPADLARNLHENALPADLAQMDATNYPEFLEHRRLLMAQMMRRYYEAL